MYVRLLILESVLLPSLKNKTFGVCLFVCLFEIKLGGVIRSSYLSFFPSHCNINLWLSFIQSCIQKCSTAISDAFSVTWYCRVAHLLKKKLKNSNNNNKKKTKWKEKKKTHKKKSDLKNVNQVFCGMYDTN